MSSQPGKKKDKAGGTTATADTTATAGTTAMKSAPARHQLWWQLFALIAVSTVAVTVGNAFHEQLDSYAPESRPLVSIFNKKPSGLSGFDELVKTVGLPVHPWLMPYRQLRGTQGVLVIVAPSSSLEEFEAEQILKWVDAGNDLVFIDHFAFASTRRLLKKLGVGIHDQRALENANIQIHSKRPEFDHVHNLVITSDTRVTGGVPLVQLNEDTIFSVLEHGDGRILIGTSPSLCSNRRFSDHMSWDNFQFLINWLRTAHGEIMFDERCHGYSQSGNIFITLARSPVGTVSAQIFLILAVAVSSAATRFGALGTIPNERKVSNLEFISGLANAYRRARANGAILDIMSQQLRARLGKFMAISPHEPIEKLADSWEERSDASQAPVREFFSDLDSAMAGNQVTDSYFKKSVANYDKINQFLESLSAKKVREPGSARVLSGSAGVPPALSPGSVGAPPALSEPATPLEHKANQ